jgi:peptidoglycan/xylan/chitin deacetylase (PgdA/CDA1 family)
MQMTSRGQLFAIIGLAAIGFAALCLTPGGVSRAVAADCPGNPDALGTSRTLVVDPLEHPRVGGMNYAETLPLADKEIVITFDDGPIAPYTGKILDILASECVRATYFIVGEMAQTRPELVRRAAREGHTIGTHSMTHPYGFQWLPLDKGKAQMDDGIAATTAALGDTAKLAPFFRFPGFGRTDEMEDYAQSRGLMVWGADFPADDWTHISDKEITRRALMRLEHLGKGILLLHDIHPATVRALPVLLHELKVRGYHVVHVVPATDEQQKTATTPKDWLIPNMLPAMVFNDVQELKGDFFSRISGEDLCSLRTTELRIHPTARRQVASGRHYPVVHHGRQRDDRRRAQNTYFQNWN